MEGLQRDEGIVLPSRDWKLTDSMETIKQELESICEREPFVWGKAVGLTSVCDILNYCVPIVIGKIATMSLLWY